MRFRLTLLPLGLAALTLTGCHVKLDEPVVTKQANATSNYVADASTPGTATTGQSPIAPKDDETKHKGYRRERIYQLWEIKTTKITVNGHPLTAWVMDDDSHRQEGMMFVRNEDFTPDQAMLFVFPNAQEQSFWMHNTLIDLDVAYIGKDKKVVRATTMKALDETSVPSQGPSMYVLEMKAGTIQRLGIKKGDSIDIPASVKASA